MFGKLDGTMEEMSKTVDNVPVISFIDSCLRGIAEVFIANNPITGFFVLVAMFVADLWLGVASTIGVIVATATAHLLGFDRSQIRIGLFGFNGFLVGAAIPIFMAGTEMNQLIYIIVFSAFSTIIMKAMMKIMEPFGLGALTLPFNIATLIFLFGALNYGHATVGPLINPSLPIAGATVETVAYVDGDFIINAVFRGIGQLVLADSILSGILVFFGLLVTSRIMAFWAVVGSLIGMITGVALGVNQGTIYAGLWGYNAYITAIAIGGIFFVLNGKTALYAAFAAICSQLLAGAIGAFMAPWGMPVLTLPFCFAAILFISVGRTSNWLIPIKCSLTTPERHIAWHKCELSENSC
ncbi:MAG: urea transporter [Clostridium sp.]|nr:urea transporter [Dethiobacter sp.]MBS4008666.1 urea transporter [Clostridium sp.]MCL4462428.1 urea transporter [Bacillota bacterium]